MTRAFDGGYQFRHFFNIAVFRRAPRRAHAKARGAGVFGGLRGAHHLLDGEHFFGLDAGVKLGGLGAIATVFRTTAGFDRQQRRQLNVALGPVLAVHGLGLEQQIQQRLVE